MQWLVTVCCEQDEIWDTLESIDYWETSTKGKDTEIKMYHHVVFELDWTGLLA